MSQQYRTSQQQQGRTKRKEEDPDAFMRLSDNEIAGCITDIGVNFTIEDLRKPQAQQVQIVFEHLGDLLMNETKNSIDPGMRAAAEDICADFPDLVPVETRLMIGFFVSLRRLLLECGVHDFSMNDLLRPQYDRLGKIFSYVINFIRFREGQTSAIDENYNKSDGMKARMETLYEENQSMADRLDEMKRNRQAMERAVKEKVKRNDELKHRLIELRKSQERIAEELERSKTAKNRAQQILDEKTEKTVRIRQEADKLRPYVLQSPAALQSALTELSDNLNRERSQIDLLERRMRALQTSSDSFSIVHNDVQSCVKVLEEIAVETQKEEEEESRGAKNKEALNERATSGREMEQNEKQLQKQLDKWQERIEEQRKKHKEREEANRIKMEELWTAQRQLRQEREEKSREMDRRKGRIDALEKKMADLKEALEKEVSAAHEEYLKLEAHIKLYLSEMEQLL